MRSDLELVAQAANFGNKEAFALLVDRHQSRIRQFLRRLTAGDWHSADDLAQETFIAAYQKIQQFRATGTFNAWLHSIAWRLFLSWKRKQARQAEVPMIEEVFEDRGNTLDAEMTAQRLMQVLSADQRVTVTLSYAEGMTHPQISEITGIPLGTVKSHINRAIKKMKQHVKHNEQSPGQPVMATGLEGKCHAG
jgi:RNA polymerase sigma-70 factor (ECF subfamily)